MKRVGCGRAPHPTLATLAQLREEDGIAMLPYGGRRDSWIQARLEVLRQLKPFEEGRLVFYKGRLSKGATNRHVWKLRNRLARIDAKVPTEWLEGLVRNS